MSSSVNNPKRKYFSLADIIVTALILIAVAVSVIGLVAGSSDNELIAVVSVRGEVYTEIALSDIEEPYTLTVEGDGKVQLYISHEGVAFTESDCPDKLCVNTGRLTRGGQSSVCLPCRVSVKLVSVGGFDIEQPDAVVG